MVFLSSLFSVDAILLCRRLRIHMTLMCTLLNYNLPLVMYSYLLWDVSYESLHIFFFCFVLWVCCIVIHVFRSFVSFISRNLSTIFFFYCIVTVVVKCWNPRNSNNCSFSNFIDIWTKLYTRFTSHQWRFTVFRLTYRKYVCR